MRAEQMWEDLARLDILLGGNGGFGDMAGFQHTHGSEKAASKSSSALSNGERQALCCALLDEMKIYQHLLLAATNLSEATKECTWAEAMHKCSFKPWAAAEQACRNNSTLWHHEPQERARDHSSNLLF